jgi:predicted transcriptional regulator
MLWERETATVRDLYEALQTERPLAYTTVLTVLDRMHAKGAVQRRKNGKTFFYQPALSLAEARRQSLAQLLEFYFDGSAVKLNQYLEGQKAASGAVVEAWGEISEELL